MFRKAYRSLGLTAASLFLATQVAAGSFRPEIVTLTIRFEGLDEPQGQVMLALFDSEHGYSSRGAPPSRSLAVTATSPTTRIEITGLVPGRYAIRAFLDRDGDGRLTRNRFGIPVEPVAFSNNAPVHRGPPSWADAAFDLTAPAVSHTISFR